MKATVPAILLILSSTLFATDVGYYGIIKSQMYRQTPTTAPAILSTNGCMFNAFVIANTNGVVTNATVKIGSAGATKDLLSDTNLLSWRFEEAFNTSNALEAAYPAGSMFSQVIYTVSMGTLNDSTKTGNLDFWRLIIAMTYPPVPQISNLSAGQSIDTTRDFTLTWNTLSGSTLDIVQVTIMDMASNVVFLSGLPFSSNALNGASISVSIPANTLPPGANLQAHLSIAQADLPNTNYAYGVSALARDTAFDLATRPAPAIPFLSIDYLHSENMIHVGFPNRNQSHLSSPNLHEPSDLDGFAG